MARINTVYIMLHLTIILEILHQGCGSKNRDSRVRHKTHADNLALQKAAQRLLGLRNIPVKEGLSTDFDTQTAPKYMLDLYEKYKDGSIRTEKQVANTVRSIQAEVGVINKQTMFVFNLSSILFSEKIIKAEVHLFKRRIKLERDTDIFMEMNELGPTFLRKLDHRRIPEVARGWQAADVTTAVEACLGYTDGLPRMMALGFSAPKGKDDTLTRLTTRALTRRISRPCLVVYSNDTQNISVDHIHPHIQPSDMTSTYVDPSTGLVQRFSSYGLDDADEPEAADDVGDEIVASAESEPTSSSSERKSLIDKKFLDYFSKIDVFSPKVEYKVKLKKTEKDQERKNKHQNEVHVSRRHRRSVLDNEIPEASEDEIIADTGYAIPKTHPGILKSRTNHRLPRKQGKLIPYPKDYKKQRRKERNQRRRKHRQNRRNRERQNGFSSLDLDTESVMSDQQVKQLCGKKTLAVNFADIGWSEWIIAPSSFEANYCSGSCSSPLSQKLKPLSNHATIQSLVHAIGLNSQVPGPCCVPSKMSSVALLYIDGNKNVVLKSYPDMSVESCGCI